MVRVIASPYVTLFAAVAILQSWNHILRLSIAILPKLDPNAQLGVEIFLKLEKNT